MVREMWLRWRLKFTKWNCLCPVLIADPLGLIVVMARARTGITNEELERHAPDPYPDVTCEWKPECCGWIDGRLVAIDYGLPWADSVCERREYYANFDPSRAS